MTPDPPPPQSRTPRNSRGKWVPSPDTAERDAKAFAMRSRECTFSEIAIALGYSDSSHVSKALNRHMATIVKPSADEYRKILDDQLSEMHRQVLRVLETTHYRVNNGVVVHHRPADCECLEGECGHFTPLLDDSPVLAAVDRLIKVQERRAKLYGLDAPVKAETVSTTNVRVIVQGADDV